MQRVEEASVYICIIKSISRPHNAGLIRSLVSMHLAVIERARLLIYKELLVEDRYSRSRAFAEHNVQCSLAKFLQLWSENYCILRRPAAPLASRVEESLSIICANRI